MVPKPTLNSDGLYSRTIYQLDMLYESNVYPQVSHFLSICNDNINNWHVFVTGGIIPRAFFNKLTEDKNKLDIDVMLVRKSSFQMLDMTNTLFENAIKTFNGPFEDYDFVVNRGEREEKEPLKKEITRYIKTGKIVNPTYSFNIEILTKSCTSEDWKINLDFQSFDSIKNPFEEVERFDFYNSMALYFAGRLYMTEKTNMAFRQAKLMPRLDDEYLYKYRVDKYAKMGFDISGIDYEETINEGGISSA